MYRHTDKRSVRDHRKWLLRQKGAFSRCVHKKNYAYIGPRAQYPPSPARPVLWIAEGAETTTKNQRLLCAGRVIKVKQLQYHVVTLYWCGSRGQGVKRWSPRSSLFVLLKPITQTPLSDEELLNAETYVRADVDDLLHPLSPDPVVNSWVSFKSATKTSLEAVRLINAKATDSEWWETPSIIRTDRRDKELVVVLSRSPPVKRKLVRTPKTPVKRGRVGVRGRGRGRGRGKGGDEVRGGDAVEGGDEVEGGEGNIHKKTHNNLSNHRHNNHRHR